MSYPTAAMNVKLAYMDLHGRVPRVDAGGLHVAGGHAI
jgi:hypothetical protein